MTVSIFTGRDMCMKNSNTILAQGLPMQTKKQWQEYYFKKNCNHVAKAVLFNLVLQLVLVFVYQLVYLMIVVFPTLIPWISQNPGMSLDQITNQIYSILAANGQTIAVGYLPIAVIMLICNTVPFILCARKTGVRIRGLFQGVPLKIVPVLLGFVVVLGVNYLGGLLYQLLNFLLGQANIQAGGDSLGLPAGGPVIEIVAYFVFCCVIAPITEEFMFRGVLLKSLSRYGTRFALIITSLLFGLIHGNLQQIPSAFLIGFVFGYIAIKTGSIKMTILLHFLNNTLVTAQEAAVAYGGPMAVLVMGIVNMVLIIGCLAGAVIIVIVNRRKLRLVSDDPKSAMTDNIIPIEHPYRKFFARLFVIILLVVVVLLILSTFQIG